MHNGEIYNSEHLRRRLRNLGHVFRTTCDTEVVAHAFRAWGINAPQHFEGMFAIAVWDESAGKLTLAVDRAGEKPLYFAAQEKCFAFASEPRALLSVGIVPERFDPIAIDRYLSLQYVPPPFCAIAGIQRLEPGTVAVVERQDLKLSVQRYWQLKCMRERKPAPPTPTEASEEILSRLRSAVRLRLVGDYPVGVLLSGGIDSSLILAMMAEVSGAPIPTFTVGFSEQDFDESEMAATVARRFNADHHHLRLRGLPVDLVAHIGSFMDEPLGDPSLVPTFALARMAARQQRVVLSGDGGDEIFGGYGRYVLPAMQRCSGARSAFHRSVFSDSDRRRLYVPDFSRLVGDWTLEGHFKEASASCDSDNEVDRALQIDFDSYMPGALLTKMDRASMANSLEVRSPFLAHPIMEYGASLPPNLKVRGPITKYLLRHAAIRLLPREVATGRKMGFCMPIDRWLREDPGRALVSEVLLPRDAISHRYFRAEMLNALVGLLDQGHRVGTHVWCLLMLEFWFRSWCDEPVAAS